MHNQFMTNCNMKNIIFFLNSTGISAFIFGFLSDLTIRKGWMSKLTSRRLFESIALFGSGGCLMLIPLVSCDENIICMLMILSSICYAAISGGDNIIVCDLSLNYR